MRLFIGLPIPETLQKQLERAWEGSPEHPGSKTIKPSQWHMTLAFLDDVPEERLPALTEIVDRSLRHPPAGGFSISGFSTFPKRKPSRVIATLEPENPKEWNEYVMGLREMLSLVAPNVDRKPWRPHISITRSEKKVVLRAWEVATELIPWVPDEVALIKSIPGPEGSTYTRLHAFPLHV